MSETIRELQKSAVPHRAAVRRTRDAEPAEQLEVSVYLKPRGPRPGDAPASPVRRETRAELQARRAAEHGGDIGAVEAFAARHGLRVVSAEPGRRRVRLAGSAAQFGAAFGVSLGMYDAGEGEFRSYSGVLSVPESVSDRIESVLGLDNRRVAWPFIAPRAVTGTTAGYRPNEAAAQYNFPANATGAGQCIALLEFGGGYHDSDTAAAFAAMGLPAPTVVTVGVDGVENNPGPSALADNEVAMDIQIAGGLAYEAVIAVYFAPYTIQGWVDAVTAAAHDTTNKPSVISVSWGDKEAAFGPAEMDSLNSALQDAATLGISVFAACGDSWAVNSIAGRPDQVSVNFPASSPWAIGCGGTSIVTSGPAITSEVAWNSQLGGTGGGISDYFAVPAFQAGTALPPSLNDGGVRRGVPDVAANADPLNGYQYIWAGQKIQNAGTSAVAPLWAGLTARLNELRRRNEGTPSAGTIGFLLPLLYQYPSAVRDITSGNNKAPANPDAGYPAGPGYDAGPGWDACTGLGAPDGGRLAALLAGPVRSGTALAATAWFDGTTHVRVFGQDTQHGISQFGWDGDWAPGVSWPGLAPQGKLYATQWFGPQGTLMSVFYQDGQGNLREQRYTAGSWAAGPFVVPAAPGSGIAAVSWNDGNGIHMRAYYQDADGRVREFAYEKDGWWPGAVIAAGAAPGTSVAAAQWFDRNGIHIRVYYQDAGNVVREHCFDTSAWQPGHQFTAPAATPGTGLAAVFWSDPAPTNASHLRVYYQDPGGLICEQSADGGQWQTDRSFAAAPGSGLAAAHWLDITRGAHVRVYYQDPQNVIREQCYDTGAWLTGQFVLPTR
jgi:kumamolisin